MSEATQRERGREKRRNDDLGRGLWKRILTPLDFSPPSEAALAYTLTLARVGKAEVYACHIIPLSHILDAFHEPGLTSPENVKRITHKARTRIKEIAAAQGFIAPLHIRFREGEAPEHIIELATQLQVDLIVMGTHGRQGVSRFFLGSVTEAVIRRATCPVLTLRG